MQSCSQILEDSPMNLDTTSPVAATPDALDSDQRRHDLLRWAQWLIILAAFGSGAGRILSAEKQSVHSPLFSANDRSRWATVLALVDYRTFAIDEVIERDGRRTKWHTIDRVQHRDDRDGRQRSYSSKPPLFPTLVAIQYAALKQTGVTLEANTTYVIRLLLLTTNLAPFLIYLLAVQRMVNSLAKHDATKLLVLALAGWGTYLSSFLITLNNHLPAAIGVMITIVFLAEILRREAPPGWLFAPAGLFAAFAVTNELPSLAFFTMVGVILALKSPRNTIFGFAPPALLVCVAFLGLNFFAHGHIVPPYAHRKDGGELGRLDERLRDELGQGELSQDVKDSLASVVGEDASEGAHCFRASQDRWSIELRKTEQRFALVDDHQRGLSVRAWGNWYDYPASYWMSAQKGVDRGEPSRAVYAFHALIGHHGIFSLTPIWFLAVLGGWIMFRRGGGEQQIAICILVLTVVVIGFYIARPEIDRNYGGVSCAFRWSFWLIPLWLIPLIPGVDWCVRRKWSSVLCLLMLTASIASAQYSSANPWTHPWLFEYLTSIGWINYA